MIKMVVIVFLSFLIFVQPVHAKDPCTTVLCMAGMLQGAGTVNGCSGAVNNYFSIIKFNLKGGVSLNKTFKARGAFLGQCGTAGSWPTVINAAYGRIII